MAEYSERVRRVLDGVAAYDDLQDGAEQRMVRLVWRRRIHERCRALDLAAELEAIGDAWVELDVDGAVVVRRQR